MKIHAKIKLLQIFSDALTFLKGESLVADYCRENPMVDGMLEVIAIGKAAASMTVGAYLACEDQIQRTLVITKEDHSETRLSVLPNVTVLESAHPYPDQRTLDCGQALLEFCASIPDDRSILVLISGGASSLVDCIDEQFDHTDLRRLNEWLLASGLPIEQINRIRKAVSKIKAGRLAPFLNGHTITQLLISDVPMDDPAVIGSGLLVACDLPTKFDLKEISGLPGWVNAMASTIHEPPTSDDACFSNITTSILANNAMLREQTLLLAKQNDLTVRQNLTMDGDWLVAAKQMAQDVQNGLAGLYLWGGEVTVQLPNVSGNGGRCQNMALYLATVFQGDEHITILAAGSDGSDGPTEQAGALVDAGTIMRGIDAGFDPDVCLREANAGDFLQASGDLLDTGATGTNIQDLVLILKTE